MNILWNIADLLNFSGYRSMINTKIDRMRPGPLIDGSILGHQFRDLSSSRYLAFPITVFYV